MAEKKLARKIRSKTPENETTPQKLVRLGIARIDRAVKALNAVARLAAYKPTENQAIAIVNCLSSKLTEVKAQLQGSKTGSGFSFPEQ